MYTLDLGSLIFKVYLLHFADHVSIWSSPLTDFDYFVTNPSLPIWVCSKEHEAPESGHRSGLISSQVNVLAVIDDEVVGCLLAEVAVLSSLKNHL